MLPLGREAAPPYFSNTGLSGFATASQSSGSKLPRHRNLPGHSFVCIPPPLHSEDLP
ncbi:hypothetical protein EMIT0P100_190091 [Pseudomonas sp. IT-P100]